MGDAGEGLVDNQARIQERLEEIERERSERRVAELRDPETQRALESLRLARAELVRQRDATTHARGRATIDKALAEIDRRAAAVSSRA
jgi:hypothetical protein